MSPARWRIPRDLPWITPYPLPRDTAEELMDREGETENLGLKMDRLLPHGLGRQGPELVREFADRGALVPDLAPLSDLVVAWRVRWERVAAAADAVTFNASPEWRVIVGLGGNALLQGGITLHHVYGLPFIPATSLKGITRLYAEVVVEVPEEEVARLFGDVDGEARLGELQFLDGVPAEPPRIERDLMNPHYALYYGGQNKVPPGDYLSPTPVFLLTLGRGSLYRFGVASLPGNRADAELAAGWMRSALGEVGLGAKTAAGYGYWVVG